MKVMLDGEQLNNDSSSSLKDYSTEEHVVGTWIDGRPVYRQVIVTSEGKYSPITSGSSTWIASLSGHLINAFGYVYHLPDDTNIQKGFPIPSSITPSSNETYYFTIRHVRSSGSIVLDYKTSVNTWFGIHITLDYVKDADM